MSLRTTLPCLIAGTALFLVALAASGQTGGSSERPGLRGRSRGRHRATATGAGAAQQFDTDFSRHTVPFRDILSGGVPKDGITPIDNPGFIPAGETDDWLEATQPVIVVEAGGEAKAYPLQVIARHEVVNDEVGGIPITVTYCPLCNTGLAFEREFDGRVLDFDVSGNLRFSNLIMWDRQTER